MHSASSGASQQSANSAPPSAALTSAQKAHVDDIKNLGRLPKYKKGASSADDQAEDKLARRYNDHKGGLPEDIKQELRGLGGAPQPPAWQALEDDIKSLGRMPTRKTGTSADDQTEAKLAKQYEKLMGQIPEEIKPELRGFGGAPQPLTWQALVDDKSLGRMPTRKRGTSADDQKEAKLAKQYDKLKGQIPEDIKQDLRGLGGAPQPCLAGPRG